MTIEKEQQLDDIVNKAITKAEQITLAPPIFELYAALLSMSLAVLMFLVPELLAGRFIFYDYMTMIFPQVYWAIGFFIGGVVSAVGMLLNRRPCRIIGLIVMAVLYGMLTGIYAIMLPNFGFILMLWITVFTIASIPLTRFTGIWKPKKGEILDDSEGN